MPSNGIRAADKLRLSAVFICAARSLLLHLGGIVCCRLYQYQGDSERYFIYYAWLIECYEDIPLHRLDINFPRFSSDAFKNIEISFNADMVHADNVEYRKIRLMILMILMP